MRDLNRPAAPVLAVFLWSNPRSDKPGLMTVEVCLTLIAGAVAFGWPEIASGLFQRAEKAFARLARRRALAVTAVGVSAALLRLAALPLCPVPHPFVPDDFSFLLAGDTFASGRLTNPTPALWVHFESIHISMTPTYMSMYFPVQGLVLAAAKTLTGQPWFGVLCMTALMCAAICWMLQAWLPPGWALLGGGLAIMRLGLFSCWINTYHTAGPIAATGGALVLGAFPRLLKSQRPRSALLLSLGVIMLAGTRPYEGLLLCLPAAAVVGHWLLFGKNRPSTAVLFRLSVAPLALILAAGACMGYYNYRVFGSPLTLPYTVNRATYAMAPYFVWQSPRPEPAYRHEVLRRFYYDNELAALQEMNTLPGFTQQTLLKLARGVLFFSGVALLWPLLMFRRVLLDRRTRFLVLCIAVMTIGMLLQIFFLAYYVAPFTAAFYALGLQAMRHMRQLKLEGARVGQALVRLSVALCVILCGVRLLAGPLHISMPEWPASAWNFNWYGPADFGRERAQIKDALEQLPGRQLAIVRYSPEHNPLDEWVYNAPDIADSKVIWARDMNPAENLELIRHYRNRQIWLIEPDLQPPRVSPYPASKATVARQAGDCDALELSSPIPPDGQSAAQCARRLADASRKDSRNSRRSTRAQR